MLCDKWGERAIYQVAVHANTGGARGARGYRMRDAHRCVRNIISGGELETGSTQITPQLNPREKKLVYVLFLF